MTDSRPLNYTTTVPASRTIGECQAILAKAGAASVAVHYEDGEPTGLSFTLKTPHGQRNFTLPVNVDGMAARMRQIDKDGAWPRNLRPHMITRYLSRQHAAAVAWRVVKDWLEAQLAIIAAHMATLDEVMLPYLHVGDDRTLYQAYREREQAALLPGER
jgi:hypothetical protein